MGKRGAKDNQICSHCSLSQFSFEPFLPFIKTTFISYTCKLIMKFMFSFNVIFLDKFRTKTETENPGQTLL